MSEHWTDKLVEMHACAEAVEWATGFPTLQAAWKACERGDWMLWLIGRTTTSAPWSEERKPLVRVAVECAMLAPPCPDEYELARQWCIDAVLRWCDGEADQDEVLAARAAAAYAVSDAYAAAANANDAAYAADAANVAADVWRITLLRVAQIVRRHFPQPPSLEER